MVLEHSSNSSHWRDISKFRLCQLPFLGACWVNAVECHSSAIACLWKITRSSSLQLDVQHEKLRNLMAKQMEYENALERHSEDIWKSKHFPDPQTDCKPPPPSQEFQTPRLGSVSSSFVYESPETCSWPATEPTRVSGRRHSPVRDVFTQITAETSRVRGNTSGDQQVAAVFVHLLIK